jgi:hypothetical protein
VTLINRTCFELSDIVGIQLECDTCHTLVSLKPRTWIPDSIECPGCRHHFVKKESRQGAIQSPEFSALEAFVNAMKTLSTMGAQLNCQLRLEFEHT